MSGGAAEVDRFARWVADRFGLTFDEGRRDLLGNALRERVMATGAGGAADYLDRLERDRLGPGEARRLVSLLTIGETFFFRNGDHFRALREEVLPALAEARREERRLRILSAGCATGEEPYSVAILLAEGFPALAGWEVEIAGVDVDPQALSRARLGVYGSWSLRETAEAMRARWFTARGDRYELAPEIRRRVRFEEHNLASGDDHDALLARGRWDLVLCRNVTIYFDREVTRPLIERFARALEPDGFLFLGHSETLRGISQAFHLLHTHDTFYYRVRDERRRVERQRRSIARVDSRLPRVAAPAALEDSWAEPITSASRRVAALLSRRGEAPAPPDAVAPAASYPQVLELMREERHEEALRLAEEITAGAGDTESLLLLAVLLTNQGDVERAEKVCRRVLDRDELSAGAHYLLALCHEHAGRREEAAEHDRIAVYLDPSFAMPHLHLGLLAKRDGGAGEAREELAEARRLLAEEDGSRLLLFGGGFTRDGLIGICSGELAALEAGA